MTVKYPKPLNRPSAPAIRVTGAAAALLSGMVAGIHAESRTAWVNHRIEGLRLLCDYYDIPWGGSSHDPFFELACKLAEDHVPYFKQRKPRSKAWDLKAQTQLVLDVWDMQELGRKYPRRFANSRSVRGACEALYRQGKYKQKGLEQRYKEACRDLVLRYSRKRLGDPRWRELLVNLAKGAEGKK